MLLLIHGAIEILNRLAQRLGYVLRKREQPCHLTQLIARFLFTAGGAKQLSGLQFRNRSVQRGMKPPILDLLQRLFGTLGGRAVCNLLRNFFQLLEHEADFFFQIFLIDFLNLKVALLPFIE